MKIFRSKNHKILSMVLCRRLLRLAHLVRVFPSFPNLPRSQSQLLEVSQA